MHESMCQGEGFAIARYVNLFSLLSEHIQEAFFSLWEDHSGTTTPFLH